MRNAVRLKSSRFNSTDVKDYFINDICFGDDLANWLFGELKKRGMNATEPWQEDWGWQFEAENCSISIGFDGDQWQIFIEPIRSIFQRLFGQKLDISVLTKNLHSILTSEPSIYEIEWFVSNTSGTETDFGNEP